MQVFQEAVKTLHIQPIKYQDLERHILGIADITLYYFIKSIELYIYIRDCIIG